MNTDDKGLTSTKPYLLRALYDWIVDNSCTPYIIVDINVRDVVVPDNYDENGKIVLNIAETAVRDFQMTDSFLEFFARFDGVERQLYIPMDAILAIYAQENGRGMGFGQTNEPSSGLNKPTSAAKPPPNKPKGKPTLKVIK